MSVYLVDWCELVAWIIVLWVVILVGGGWLINDCRRVRIN